MRGLLMHCAGAMPEVAAVVTVRRVLKLLG